MRTQVKPKGKEKDYVMCAECGMYLKSLTENHTYSDCIKYLKKLLKEKK
jgi:hypothetical protein